MINLDHTIITLDLMHQAAAESVEEQASDSVQYQGLIYLQHLLYDAADAARLVRATLPADEWPVVDIHVLAAQVNSRITR